MIKLLINNAREIDSLFERLASNEWNFGTKSDNYRNVKEKLEKLIDKEDTIIRALKEQGFYEKMMDEMNSIGRYYHEGDNIFDVIIDKYEYNIVRLQEKLNLYDNKNCEKKGRNLYHYARQKDIFNHFLLIIDEAINDENPRSRMKKELIKFKYRCIHMMPSEERSMLVKDFSIDSNIIFGTDILKSLDISITDEFKNVIPCILDTTVRSLMQVPKQEENISEIVKCNTVIKLMALRAVLPFADEKQIEILKEINAINHLNVMMNQNVIETMDVLLDNPFIHDMVQRASVSPYAKKKIKNVYKKSLNKDKE